LRWSVAVWRARATIEVGGLAPGVDRTYRSTIAVRAARGIGGRGWRERKDLTENTGVGVLVLCAAADGQAAILAILRDVPVDFDMPIVVVQHLPVES
jgi:chemotaxis response regulator CheB